MNTTWISSKYTYYLAVLAALLVKNLPAVQETLVPLLDPKGPLEEGMATHSNILAWRIPMDRGTWQATIRGIAKSWIQLSNEAQHTSLTENEQRNEEMRHSFQQLRVTGECWKIQAYGLHWELRISCPWICFSCFPDPIIIHNMIWELVV